MKTILIFLLMAGVAFGQHPVLRDDSSILLPDVEFQGQMLGLEVVLCHKHDLLWEICDWRELTNEFLTEINRYRRDGAPCSTGGLAAVEWDVHLAEASRLHSEDMRDNNYFSHTGLDGSSPWERVSRTEFRGQPRGENIASGYRSATGAVQGWINSPGHCVNIMNPQVNVMGYGSAGSLHTMITGIRPR